MERIKGLLIILCFMFAAGLEATPRKKQAKLYLKGTVPKVVRVDKQNYEVKANHPIKVRQSRSPASTAEILTVISE